MTPSLPPPCLWGFSGCLKSSWGCFERWACISMRERYLGCSARPAPSSEGTITRLKYYGLWERGQPARPIKNSTPGARTASQTLRKVLWQCIDKCNMIFFVTPNGTPPPSSRSQHIPHVLPKGGRKSIVISGRIPGKGGNPDEPQVHFLHRHVWYTVVIPYGGNYHHPYCLHCDISVPWTALNYRHSDTYLCAKVAESKCRWIFKE